MKKLSTRSYKGARDIYPEDMRLRQYIFGVWRKVCQSFGYEEYDAPLLEPIELYAAKSGQEIVSEQTYSFVDRGEREVAIRPEMTPSVVRMVAARRQEMAFPARLFSISNFLRYERPQHGREREFWQLNVDLFGVSGVSADIEMLEMTDAILQEFGANRKMYEIRLNDRRLTDFIMKEYLGLDSDSAQKTIKLLDRKVKMCPEAFHEQAEAIFGDTAVEKVNLLNSLSEVRSLDDLPEEILENAPVADLKEILETFAKRGMDNIFYDASLMRGFDYYTGVVFEVFDTSPENNRSLFGGGRYDGLVGLFGVEDLPVVGFAPGETTTINFLKTWGLLPEFSTKTDLFLIPLGGVDVSAVANKLRQGGTKVAVADPEKKLKKSIQSAEKMGIKNIMVVGEDELESGNFKIKNLETGKETSLDIL